MLTCIYCSRPRALGTMTADQAHAIGVDSHASEVVNDPAVAYDPYPPQGLAAAASRRTDRAEEVTLAGPVDQRFDGSGGRFVGRTGHEINTMLEVSFLRAGEQDCACLHVRHAVPQRDQMGRCPRCARVWLCEGVDMVLVAWNERAATIRRMARGSV